MPSPHEHFTIKEVIVDNPEALEVTFALVRPKAKECSNLIIIACALYSPPNSKKKSKTVDHIAVNYNNLKVKYPSAYFMCGGDINDLKITELLYISQNFRQIVTKPTRKGKILSVIVTDLHMYYQEPEIFPPVQPDVVGKGKPSDHSTPIAMVHIDTSTTKKNTYRWQMIRPLPESQMREFGNWIVKESFENVIRENH